MIKLETYRHKFYALVAGSLLFLMFLYLLTFSRTWEEYVHHQRTAAQILASKEAPRQVQELKEKLSRFDEIQDDGRAAGHTGLPREQLLEAVSRYSASARVQVISVDAPHVSAHQALITQTMVVKLKGSFTALLLFLSRLESVRGIGVVRSATFSANKGQNKKEELYLTVYLQTINLEARTIADTKK